MKALAYSLMILFGIIAIGTFYFGVKKKGRLAFIRGVYIFFLIYTATMGVFFAH